MSRVGNVCEHVMTSARLQRLITQQSPSGKPASNGLKTAQVQSVPYLLHQTLDSGDRGLSQHLHGRLDTPEPPHGAPGAFCARCAAMPT